MSNINPKTKQHCHYERSSAIHKTRNPHVISRLTGNPGNKDFNTFWMPDQVGHDNGVVSQSGRSMVEMLGTLAIVGVLSAGAIGGYSYAMNKHRTNELIYEATKRAQWVGTQLEMNNPNPSLNTFGTDSFGGGRFTGDVLQLENGQIGIKVADLKKAVCQNILNSIGDNTVIREMKDVNCNDDNGTATLVFNRDLSTSDSEITPNEPEVSGEVSAQASTEAPTTQDPDEVHCSGNGSWNGSSCYCDNGWQGDNCSEEEPESSEPATINNEPEETATAQSGDAECNYRGTWCGSSCNCNSGWGGSDCSEDHRNDCSGHGWWHQSNNNGAGGCDCNSGWGGSDCSKCSGHGSWNQSLNNGAGGCSCYADWGGSDCSQTAAAACSGNGTWESWYNNGAGGCYCNSGWGGSDCSEDQNALYCSGRGIWDVVFGVCVCNSGWGGSDCSQTARAACADRGVWHSDSGSVNGGYCECDSGLGGSDCSEDHTNDCSGHGTWYQSNNNGAGGCNCNDGWSGSDCSEEVEEEETTTFIESTEP